MGKEQAMQGAHDRVRMTYDDLLALPDDGLRHELIDGEHFVTPSPASRHQIILANLHRYVGPHTYATKCGVTLFAPYDIVFTKYDVVEPDLIYFSTDRYAEVVTEKNAQGPPNLAVEILSPGRHTGPFSTRFVLTIGPSGRRHDASWAAAWPHS